MKTVLLGGTGLIGRQVLNKTAGFVVMARREMPEYDGIHQVIVAGNLLDLAWPEQCEQVICCMGTTLKKAGSKDAFIEQDFLLTRELLARAVKNGAKRLLIVSALGASEQSMVLYSRVKGELEATVSAMGWQQVVIYQPSLLLGERINDTRPTEFFSQKIGAILAPIVPANLRPIKADTLAQRIVHDGQSPLLPGIQTIKGKPLWAY
jgi:uncharacterized protein YbjT (DUF2867 family)